MNHAMAMAPVRVLVALVVVLAAAASGASSATGTAPPTLQVASGDGTLTATITADGVASLLVRTAASIGGKHTDTHALAPNSSKTILGGDGGLSSGACSAVGRGRLRAGSSAGTAEVEQTWVCSVPAGAGAGAAPAVVTATVVDAFAPAPASVQVTTTIITDKVLPFTTALTTGLRWVAVAATAAVWMPWGHGEYGGKGGWSSGLDALPLASTTSKYRQVGAARGEGWLWWLWCDVLPCGGWVCV